MLFLKEYRPTKIKKDKLTSLIGEKIRVYKVAESESKK